MEGIVVGSNFFQKPSSKKKNYRKRTFDEDDNIDASIFRQTKGPKLINASNVATNFEYESSEQIQIEHDSRATASVETETEFSRDWQSIRERYLKQADDVFKGKRIMRSGNLYEGINGYIDYSSGFRRELRVSNEKARGAYGPLRASLYIRKSVRFDYQPDICKDYKETGYCGYGDACKFMHDRGDYKSGWQLEKEWEEAEKARKSNILVMDHEKGIVIGDSLPSYCFICENPFVDPVVTKCNHYFCLLCALQHNSRNTRCIICNEPTHGLFNTAHQILQSTKAAK